jgi:hypothetical protein
MRRRFVEHSLFAPGAPQSLGTEEGSMPHAKQASKRKRRTALPTMGIAGASLALAGSASAAVRPEPNIPSWGTGPLHEITLGEEEVSDVSLATFYVFDHETQQSLQGNVQLAARGCGGCGRCGGGCRCGGVGRCAVARCAVARCAGCAGCRSCRCGVGGCFGISIGCGWGCSCSCCWSWGFCRLC